MTHDLTFHGGNLEAAAARFPDAPPWLDLSTGINPFAWPAGTIAAADQHRLPSPAALAGLERAAAAAFGARGVAIAALPGSEIGLRLVAHLGLPKPWRVVTPGYRTHAAALPGARPIDAAAVAGEAANGGTILLANPANPTGALVDPAGLLAIARRLAAAGGVLVVDEAFADAVPGAGLLPALSPDDRVLVFRSFGKFFGLAGVRLGFACGAAGPVGGIAAMLGGWPVSASAIAIGTAAYADTGWIAAMPAWLAAARAALDAVLAGHGLRPRGACPLFRLVETPEAGAIFDRLGRTGILVRPFADAPHRLRFGLPGSDAALARLDGALGHR